MSYYQYAESNFCSIKYLFHMLALLFKTLEKLLTLVSSSVPMTKEPVPLSTVQISHSANIYAGILNTPSTSTRFFGCTIIGFSTFRLKTSINFPIETVL